MNRWTYRRVRGGGAALVALALTLSGTGVVAAQSEEGPIVIGQTTPTSGPVAPSGEQHVWGAQLGADHVNAEGGVLGRELQIVVEDNACNPTEGVNAVNSLLGRDVPIILGALCSSVTLAVMPVMAEAGVPLLVGNSTSPDIRAQSGVGGNEWTFRIISDDSQLTPALANFIEREGEWERVAIIAEDTDFGRGGAETFASELEERGIETISIDYFPQGTTDFSTVLTRIQQAAPDAIGIYALGADGLNFARGVARQGLEIPLTGKPEIDAWREVVETGALDGTVSAYGFSNVMDAPGVAAFVQAFEEKYGVLPVVQAFMGYQQARVAADAIERAGSIDPAAVRDALEDTHYPSLLSEDSEIAFDDYHQAHDVIGILKVIDGAVTVAAYEPT